ncbi:MAG: DUF4190 domain-containing protein [Rhodanobacteraceae bacterium]|nr:DUF4190 domain-containing protein [Rhodanobacteraceae bacterium]MBK7044410.1 DUF4190 domain-containing protein [Rhodanobacteraceae bacterium]MBP9155547.1 DUF4190 domain-containing protein [Xanthomonadales bacterium]HQW81508.1 DUF4190 domain-containing protein [Pseudomonadota bacterium]
MTIPARPNSTSAILSLVFGVVAWFMVPVLGAIAAVVCGHIARGEIRRSNGQLDGDGMAIAGLVLGYLQLTLTVALIVLFAIFFGGVAAFLAYAAAQG